MGGIEQTIREVSGQVKEVYEVLVGNKIAGDGGLVERIKILEAKSEVHDKFQSAVLTSWKLLCIIGVLVGSIVGFLIAYYKH